MEVKDFVHHIPLPNNLRQHKHLLETSCGIKLQVIITLTMRF